MESYANRLFPCALLEKKRAARWRPEERRASEKAERLTALDEARNAFRSPCSSRESRAPWTNV
ncbi:hypothetical protein ColLi_02116 [Colletotrichum liriopes]|uniref:Uncharacterized protein n=1 Tax=Colletotrichum liriopes TaxID=708192 RepID=A0AA37GE63_9PEZI|nr:hypothetical protein ColLi_02116 [Colletotrichum liriopes]